VGYRAKFQIFSQENKNLLKKAIRCLKSLEPQNDITTVSNYQFFEKLNSLELETLF
jgi:hypothetical protein